MTLINIFLDTIVYLYEFTEKLDELDIGLSDNKAVILSSLSESKGNIKLSSSLKSHSDSISLVKKDHSEESKKNDYKEKPKEGSIDLVDSDSKEVEDSSLLADKENNVEVKDIFFSIDVNSIFMDFKEKLSIAWTEGEKNNYAPKIIERAAYVVIALIDERIMSTMWGRKNNWFKNSLQVEYFSVGNAGMQVFKYIDEIKEASNYQKYLAEVYYYCLCCGFKGANFNNPVLIREYKVILFQLFKSYDKSDDNIFLEEDENIEENDELMESKFIINIKHILSNIAYQFLFILMLGCGLYFYFIVSTLIFSVNIN